MEIFMKKLTSVDIDRRLELPTDTRREALPPFQDARENMFPIMLEQAGVEVRGWIEIARHLRLNAGDVVTLRREDQGGYKMTVKSRA
ncbi:hypothetical protein NC652_012156 [Populus alba x Populus x berolinensis]|nr:hypothetical protein NC652_012156 [Populus alba x Populus x berolinensis]